MHGIIRHGKLGIVGMLWISLLFMGVAVVNSQHDHTMHKAPAAKKPTRKRAPRRKPRRTARKPAAPKASPSPTPHQHVPGMPMPAASPAASPHQHVPGMPMPAASPTASPHQHVPGMPMPAASPTASPHQHTPGMPMPAASPSASPHQHTPGMPMPAASPSASPHQHVPTASPSASPASHAPGTHASGANLGPLLVMIGDEMGIRVGSSDKNVMSMGAMGSGSAWQPSSGPMHMHHWNKNDWLLMLHYNAFVGVNAQGGPRGVTKFESANWLMPMAFRKLGRGTLQLRGMFSAEPFTFPPGGSPLLFQTGETYKGQPIIDRQHPHDLFMELSAQYTHPLGERGTWFTYFGYPGEPALGPVAFMHRASAAENPAATLAHHLQDSTHITFGVLTTGFTYRWFKLEGSIFNGREPDEGRYDFDAHKWNSRAARLWFMPNQNWALQVSHGFLRSPEGNEPEVDVRRTTASLQYNRKFDRGNWASGFVWGRNHVTGHEDGIINLNSYTAESTVQFIDKNYLYTRLELVDKDDLLRPSDRALLGIAQHHPVFRIGAYTFGGARDIWNTNKVSLAVGGDVTFYSKPAILDRLYGDNPVSWKIFFRLRPAKMDMSQPGGHGTHGRE
ncbi:MAG TPA: hypothetical protein VFZ40_13275 [Pyrinomonadaceae bacterium]